MSNGRWKNKSCADLTRTKIMHTLRPSLTRPAHKNKKRKKSLLPQSSAAPDAAAPDGAAASSVNPMLPPLFSTRKSPCFSRPPLGIVARDTRRADLVLWPPTAEIWRRLPRPPGVRCSSLYGRRWAPPPRSSSPATCGHAWRSSPRVHSPFLGTTTMPLVALPSSDAADLASPSSTPGAAEHRRLHEAKKVN